jgi:hypothetical protein
MYHKIKALFGKIFNFQFSLLKHLKTILRE